MRWLAISGRDIAVAVAEPPVTDSFAERSMDVDIVESCAMARLSQRGAKKIVLCNFGHRILLPGGVQGWKRSRTGSQQSVSKSVLATAAVRRSGGEVSHGRC